MNSLHEVFAGLSAGLWPALAEHLWQATLFAAVVFAAALLLGRGPARLRYALWLVAAAKFVLPPALFAAPAAAAGLDLSWLSAAPGAGAAPAGSVFYGLAQPPFIYAGAGGAAGAGVHGELYCALTLAWLAGCAAFLFAWWLRRRAFVRALEGGREVFEGREYDALERARRRLGLRAEPWLVLSPHKVEPGVWRTLRPLVILPEEIAGHLDEDELEAVLLHELVHVRRRDNLAGNFQMLLCAALWFHPVVWLINRRLLAEREQACDEKVLELSNESGVYASGILKVVRFCFGWRVAGVSGAAAGNNLRRRIENIMAGNTDRKPSAWQRATFGAVAGTAVLFSAGMGLYGYAQSGGGRARGDEPAAQISVVVTRGGHARADAGQDAAEGPAVREIMEAPEIAVTFENAGDAPLLINEAKMRVITRRQLERADDEGADYYKRQKADQYLTLPYVALFNASGKQVSEVGIGFVLNGRTVVMLGHAARIAPGETYLFTSGWAKLNAIIPGGAQDVTVRLAWVSFQDGSQWGGRPSEPHPPEPPPPPGAPGVRTRDTSQPPLPPDEYATGGGTGEGVGTAPGGRPIRAGRGLRGKAVSAPNPVYPAIARAAGAQGMVSVRVTVDENGEVIGAEAVSGHPLLRTAAVDAARAAKFSPTRLSGKPVKVEGIISYNFVLSGKGADEDAPQ